ncbi:MAG: hypothetical protein LQ350_008685, partial [Teloschistes chrysophthalmus]
GVRVTRIDTKDDAAAATSQTWDLDHAIEASVFPRHQGGPHNHSMIAMAVAMRQARTPEFRLYQSRVLANAAALEERLRGLGCDLARGGGDDGKGTKSHQVVVGVSSSGELRAAKRVLGKVGIACGVDTGRNELRFGSYAMTTRGLLPTDFHCVADIVHHALALSTHAGKADDVESAPDGGTPLGNSQDDSMDDRFGEGATGILEMRKEVEEWMFTFTVPWD